MKNRWLAVGISAIAMLAFLVWGIINIASLFIYVQYTHVDDLAFLRVLFKTFVLILLIAGFFIVNILTAIKRNQLIGIIVNFIFFLLICLLWGNVYFDSDKVNTFSTIFFIITLIGFIFSGVDFLIYILGNKKEVKNATITPEQANEKIKELKSLLEKGIITETEYKEKSEKFIEYL